MTRRTHVSHSGSPVRSTLVGALLLLVAGGQGSAQETDDGPWDVTVPRGETREIAFSTSEGTWMSVDVSPDGAFVVFDLLGHVYRLEAGETQARALTQDSGIAINIQPRISPDGSTIAFVSDRGGQNNLWLMDADGSNPRAAFTNPMVRVTEPAWTADGEYVLVGRQALTPSGGSGIWMVHRDGGTGIEVVSTEDQPGAGWPSASADGRYLYFHVRPSPGERDAVRGTMQIRRLDLASGDVRAITAGQASQQVRSSSGGAVGPEISPDGRWLAFARRVPDGTISYKGHRFGPRTALWIRDLETGAERMVMDPIEVDMTEAGKVLRPLPGYSWSSDGTTIHIAQGGKLKILTVATGAVADLPFTADVARTVSEQAYTRTPIEERTRSRFTRWHTASPDGNRLLFQAVGRIWVMDLPDGTPRRLTPDTFQPFEYAPAWSPDGSRVAFTTLEDGGDGHLWTVATGGGEPVQLTVDPGEYTHPTWRSDGREILLTQGGGATARSRGMVWNTAFDIVRVPVSGGSPQVVAETNLPESAILAMRNQIVRPTYGPDGRIFFRVFETGGGRTALLSVRPDGSDERRHATFDYADEVVPSSDGRWIAFQEADDVYYAPFPAAGTGGEPVHVARKNGSLPVTRISTEGGLLPRWWGESTIEFGSADRYYRHDIETGTTDTVEIELSIEADRAPGTVAFSGARIVTLEEGGVIESGALVVTDGRIACVGACDVSSAERVIDASGKTLIPGFIDVHSHNFREARGMVPRHSHEVGVFLAYGVTSVMDPSLWSQNIFTAAELIDAGEVVGPRVFSTGDPLYSGDGSRQVDIATYQDAENLINRLASWGALSLKEYMQPRRDQRQWITDVARKRGLMVTAEGGDLAYNIGMILDGHTGWEHPMSYVPTYGDVAQFFGRTHTVYSPTFAVGGAGPWNEEYFLAESDVWREDKQRRWLSWRQLIPHTRRRMLRPETDYSYPLIAQSLADIIAAGGYGAIGAHAQQNGIASHWEVWMAASAMSPIQALEVASLHGAYFIGRDRDLGSLAEGKLADFMVLNSNPLDDIRNTLDIEYVVKDGRVFDGDTLDEVWPRTRPYGPYWWIDDDQLKTDDKRVGG